MILFRQADTRFEFFNEYIVNNIGVRAGGARGAAAPPKFGKLRVFGQQEKIWAKPSFKDVSMFFYDYYFEEINLFYFNLKKILK